MELGGKDPAYVRADADPLFAAEQLVDGAMYNSGQSCCAIERIYVHKQVFDKFVEHAVKTVKGYVLGSPLDPTTNLGPVVRVEAAQQIREHVKDAIAKGATPLIDESLFPLAKEGTSFVAPQILTNVDHSMKIMTEETFGPVVGIMKVDSDEEAIELMNDSNYGLTASVWTNNRVEGLAIGKRYFLLYNLIISLEWKRERSLLIAAITLTRFCHGLASRIVEEVAPCQNMDSLK